MELRIFSAWQAALLVTAKYAWPNNNNYYYYTLFLPKGKVRPADKLHLKAAIILPLVGLARSKQDPINRGHGAQFLYCPPASRGQLIQGTLN